MHIKVDKKSWTVSLTDGCGVELEHIEVLSINELAGKFHVTRHAGSYYDTIDEAYCPGHAIVSENHADRREAIASAKLHLRGIRDRLSNRDRSFDAFLRNCPPGW